MYQENMLTTKKNLKFALFLHILSQNKKIFEIVIFYPRKVEMVKKLTTLLSLLSKEILIFKLLLLKFSLHTVMHKKLFVWSFC